MAKFRDEIYDSPTIRDRLLVEAEADGDSNPAKTQYWAVMESKLGGLIERKNFNVNMMDVLPHEIQIQFAREVVRELNANCGRDGGWIVAFTHPPASSHALHMTGDNAWYRMLIIWLDEDGDPQFTSESSEQFGWIFEQGVDFWVANGEMAYQEWKRLMRDVLDIGSKDTFKRAAGERQPSIN